MDLGEDPSGKYSLLQGVPRDGYIIIEAIEKATKKRYSGRLLMRKNLFHTYYFDNLQMEFEILGSISHPYIQKLIETTYNSHVLAQIVESEEVSLMDYYKFDFPLPESVACNIFYRLVEAIYYLHSNSIVHLDIRPENVFIVDKQFKLGGFLSSRFESEDEIITGTYGTPNFQAPEIFTNQNFDGRKADVWACGIFLLAITTGKLPYSTNGMKSSESPNEYIRKQVETNENIIPTYLSEDLRDILQMMLNRETLKRATISQVRDHRWLQHMKVSVQNDLMQEIPRNTIGVQITAKNTPSPSFTNLGKVLSTTLPMSPSTIYNFLENFFGQDKITKDENGMLLIEVSGIHKSVFQAEIQENTGNICVLTMSLISGSEYRFNEIFSQIVSDLCN